MVIKCIFMIFFNSNFKYLRGLLMISMSFLAKSLSDKLQGKGVNIPQVQSYEASTSAKYDVLKAIVDYYKIHDPTFTCDDLLFRDLESEQYTFPEQKLHNESEEDQKPLELIIEELEMNVKEKTQNIVELEKELTRTRKVQMDLAETTHYLSFKIKRLEE